MDKEEVEFTESSIEREQQIRASIKPRQSLDPDVPTPQLGADDGWRMAERYREELDRNRSEMGEDSYLFYRNLDTGHFAAGGPGIHRSVLGEILVADAEKRDPDKNRATGWVYKKPLGRGASARGVYLWEKPSAQGGEPLQMAVKDSRVNPFWQDYHMEAVLVRKLNDVGCRNVITVVEWMWVHSPTYEEPIFRTCYEYAQFGDLRTLLGFYKVKKLVLPEAFIWHVFWSISNALCYCRHGTKKMYKTKTREGWVPIVHGDVKAQNILLTPPDEAISSVYPTIKLADFGFAYPVPKNQSKVQAFKSRGYYGTRAFMAPEIQQNKDGPTGGPPHGTHSDIYSLGKLIFSMLEMTRRVLKFRGSRPDNYLSCYSIALSRLASRCIEENHELRPKILELTGRAWTQMDQYRDDAIAQAQEAPRSSNPSTVLYTPRLQRSFAYDPIFQQSYLASNARNLIPDADERQLRKPNQARSPTTPEGSAEMWVEEPDSLMAAGLREEEYEREIESEENEDEHSQSTDSAQQENEERASDEAEEGEEEGGETRPTQRLRFHVTDPRHSSNPTRANVTPVPRRGFLLRGPRRSSSPTPANLVPSPKPARFRLRGPRPPAPTPLTAPGIWIGSLRFDNQGLRLSPGGWELVLTVDESGPDRNRRDGHGGDGDSNAIDGTVRNDREDPESRARDGNGAGDAAEPPRRSARIAKGKKRAGSNVENDAKGGKRARSR